MTGRAPSPEIDDDPRAAERSAARLATAAALAVIAAFVAGKAARDALLLATFSVTSLPLFIGATALLSLPLVVVAGRLMAKRGPAWLMPRLYLASAALLVAEWAMLASWPRLAAVVCFFHLGSLGAVLVSGFWSVVNERFDARSAKRLVGKIGLGATIGGVLGGVIAERTAVYLPPGSILLVLAGLQLLSGTSLRGLAGAPHATHAVDILAPGETVATVRAAVGSPLLRRLALVVLFGAVAATALDYLFKAEVTAAARAGGGGTLRLFGLYHTATNILTAVAQVLLARAAVSRLGVARAVGVLPAVVTAAAAGALLVPGLWSAVVARGAEMITRSSVYRAAYELVFAPLPERDKRSTKVVLDVGAERVGDLLGAQLVAAILFLIASPRLPLVALALAAGLAALAAAALLPRSYTAALEDSLRRRAAAGELDDPEDDGEDEDDAAGAEASANTVDAATAGSAPAGSLERPLDRPRSQPPRSRGPRADAASSSGPAGRRHRSGPRKATVPPADRDAPWMGRSTLAETGDLTGLSLLNLQLLARSTTTTKAVLAAAERAGMLARGRANEGGAGSTPDGNLPGGSVGADSRPGGDRTAGNAGGPGGAARRGESDEQLAARLRDPLTLRAAALRSGDAERVRAALPQLPPELTALAIPLVAWHAVSDDAIAALREVAPRATGALADAMLDPDREFAIRRRLPPLVAAGRPELARWALWRALSDVRFEVRYRAARALAQLRAADDVAGEQAEVLALVRRELSVSKEVWRSYQLLDGDLDLDAGTGKRFGDGEAAHALLEILRRRSATGLYHVFTLLGLTYPAEPMRLAFQGVYTDDRSLRATALEYLETTLPPDIRSLLWPLIASDETAPASGRANHELAESLRLSYPTIIANLRRLAEKNIDPS